MRKKQYLKFIFNTFLITFLAMSIIVYISLPLIKNLRQNYKVNKEIKDLEKEISDYNEKNNKLKNMIDYLKSDQFTEEQARLNLGLKKRGEDTTIIKDLPEDNQKLKSEIFNIPGLEKETIIVENNLNRWVNYFFKNKK